MKYIVIGNVFDKNFVFVNMTLFEKKFFDNVIVNVN